MRKFSLVAALIAAVFIARGVVDVDAQQGRYSIARGVTTCTSTPSLYAIGATNTGFGVTSATGSGPCATLAGTAVVFFGTSANSAASTGIASTGSVSLGAAPASTGAVRLSNNTVIRARNAANSGNVDIATVNASDQVVVAGLFPVGGVSTGYKIARVSQALDGSNPTSWSHGLTTVVAAGCDLQGTAAPGVGTSILTTNKNGAAVDIYAWKVTGAGDTTLIASTGTETIDCWAVGT